MYPVLFQVGSLTIYSLGLLWACAAFVAAWIVRLELKGYGYDPEIAVSAITTAAIAGLLGARLLFILEEWESCTQAPFEFIFSGAGFSWYGGLLTGALAAAWVLRKHKLPLAQAADIAAPALALGYGIGRIGCFLAGDCHMGQNFRRTLGDGVSQSSRRMGRSFNRHAVPAGGTGTSDAAL